MQTLHASILSFNEIELKQQICEDTPDPITHRENAV